MIKQLIEDISGCLVGTVKGSHIDTWIGSVCLISILIISILPVSLGRSESEIYLCFLIPTISIIGSLAVLKRKVSLRFSWIDALAVGWYLYSMCRLWFENPYPAAGFAIRATLMCMLYLAIRILLSGCRISGMEMAYLLIIFAVVEASMGYSQIFSGSSRHHLYLLTGSFLNPGPYSAYLAFGIVTLCGLKKFDYVNNILLIFLAVALLLTMSRAAFLSVFVCLLILFRDNLKGWKQWGIIMAVALLGITFLYFLKSGSADGRGIINYIGFHCFLDHPIWGNGIGSFFHQYALKTAEISIQNPDFNLQDVDVIDYAFNDLLLVGMEQGIVGLGFAFSLIVLVLHRLWLTCKPLFMAALSLLIFSLFSYPFELLPFQIIGVVIASYAGTHKGFEKEKEWNRYARILVSLKSFTVIFVTIFSVYNCHLIIKQRLDAENEYRRFAAFHDKAFIKDYYSLLPYLQENKHFLFDFAKILSEHGRYNDSNDMLRRGALISNDPMFLVLQANNYREMGAFQLSEKAYLNASYIMPNRIYPLYKLMMMYEQMGNKELSIQYAKEIIKFKEKIHSPAINDIKKDAYKIIQKH